MIAGQSSKTELVTDAIKFATDAHAGQYRKISLAPFIIHPIGVGKVLAEVHCAEEVVAAGVLHDIVEDTKIGFDELRKTFGERVAEYVRGVTEDMSVLDWGERKRKYIDNLGTAPEGSLLICCADKIDNLSSIKGGLSQLGDDAWKRLGHRPKEKRKWFFVSVYEALAQRLTQEPGKTLLKRYKELIKEVFGD